MKILVTGAKGFVGKNLVSALEELRLGHDQSRSTVGGKAPASLAVFACDIDTPPDTLAAWCAEADFVIHLAGINRPQNPADFDRGNRGFTETLLSLLEEAGSKAPLAVTSSIQAALDNDYGRSKQAAEQAVLAWGRRTGNPVYVFRMEGVFGKWCRPNYNSVVATFCHNVARGEAIAVRDPAYSLPLVYVDDVVDCLLEALEGRVQRDAEGFCRIHPVHTTTLGELAALIQGFAASRRPGEPTLAVPALAEGSLAKKLYSTYLSYLPTDSFAYVLPGHPDERGSFTEFLRTPERGQVSVNMQYPGITKGNHWHKCKNEKYLVVKGEAAIRLRSVEAPGCPVIEYRVSGEKLTVVDIPCGYTHSIENVGKDELVTVMWANEAFDPARPDTYFLPVLQ